MAEPSALSILDPSLPERADVLREDFRAAAPFPHIVIDDFLEPAFAASLREEFPDFERGNNMGDDGRPGGKSTLARIRTIGAAYRRLDDAIKSPEFLRLVGRLTGIDGLLYDPWYLGGGTHESRDGVSLDPHVDFNYHPSEGWHRRLNLLVYLNPVWEDAWGGCLELFRDPHVDARAERSIGPAFNRCVIFETSERSWHAFDRIRLPHGKGGLTRRSIALYFYTRERPVDEVADRHTTYYVQRKLPAHFAEGHTLTHEDVAAVRQLLDERDERIRNLYAENTALRKAQDAGLSGHLLYLAKRAYVRFRR